MNKWDEVELGAFCQILNGGTPKSNVNDYWNGEIPWITPKDMGELPSRYTSDTPRNIAELGLQKSSAKMLPENSVILSIRAPIGYVAINKVPMATNQGCRGIIPNENAIPDYLYYFLKKNVGLLNNIAGGATFKELQKKALEQLKVPLPTIQEQKQIVSLLDQAFQAIDQAKANVEKNIQNAEELFQSKLKNLFFNNNENWSYYQLGNVTKIVNGGTPKSENESFWNGNNLWITPKDMGELKSRYVDSTPRTITDLGLKKSSAKLLPSKSVILSTRAPIGYLAINQEPMATNQGCRGIIPKGDIISDFVYYFLKLNVNTLNRLGGGSTFKELTSKNLASLETPLPSLNEQEQIVKELDEILINKTKLLKTYQRKSSNLTELKNALLQKAFQGELTQENVKATADAYE